MEQGLEISTFPTREGMGIDRALSVLGGIILWIWPGRLTPNPIKVALVLAGG